MLLCEIYIRGYILIAATPGRNIDSIGIQYRQYLNDGRVKADSDFEISDYRVNTFGTY